MKKISLFLSLFLSLEVSLYAQTYYINGTTDTSLGNRPLVHNNELKIGNSTSATERTKNVIKIGDGSYIQMGEWEADNLLSFKASKYNFTNGNVGIGGSQPQFPLDICNTTPNTTKVALARLSEGTHTYLGIKSYDSQPVRCKMFAIEQVFYNKLNAAINFYRGGDNYDGFITIYLKEKDICKFNDRGLDVYGVLQAKEVRISETGWADFVFNDDYRLKPLSEVNTFIKENKRLPEIPSASEVKESEGVNLGEMQIKLLQKIEELTLYLIQQENTIQELKSKIEKLENQ
jgi:hypothetical protein